ncbi:hypothetical protein MYAER_1113 [Microcystis aeruginosa NIES-2549]|uniref:Uncharacterized protein n=1 Tax=Microcystis aeruginosa NIES-2549 TaxID=1641812 RepID=A0A0F6U2Q1_MICAE|nr:hypothetical protein MYAER_1113 [Microcystis aeruginosa NIES-2549]
MRWATKGGDLDKIPAKFYSELNQLCLRADSAGEVKTALHNRDMNGGNQNAMP